jgi:mannose-1-phosphate guanylyltransferase
VKGVVLVGGLGTRLRPLTYTLPKPMLPLLNRPFIEHVLAHLKRFGIDEVILSTGYLPSAFDGYLDDLSDKGISVELISEEEPLGTCGAVKNVADRLDDTFMVFNGDILTDINLSNLLDYHRQKGALATIALTSVDDPTSYGLVPLKQDGRVEAFLEKPSWDDVTTDLINAGTYVMEPEALAMAPAGENYSFERGLFPLMLGKSLPVYGFPASCYWLDIGTPEKFIRAHHDLLDGKLPAGLLGPEVKPRVWIGEGSTVDKRATLYGPIVIGRNCRLEPDSVIVGPACLGDDCFLSPGARVEGSVLLGGCRLEESAVVKNSILGRNITIGRKTHVDDVSVLGDNLVVGEDNWLRHGIKISPEAKILPGTIRF